MPEKMSDHTPRSGWFEVAVDEIVEAAKQGMDRDGVAVTGDVGEARTKIAKVLNLSVVMGYNSAAQRNNWTAYMQWLSTAGRELSPWNDFAEFYEHSLESIAKDNAAEHNNTMKEARIIATMSLDLTADQSVSEMWTDAVRDGRRFLGDPDSESRRVPEREMELTPMGLAAAGAAATSGGGCFIALVSLVALPFTRLATGRRTRR